MCPHPSHLEQEGPALDDVRAAKGLIGSKQFRKLNSQFHLSVGLCALLRWLSQKRKYGAAWLASKKLRRK